MKYIFFEERDYWPLYAFAALLFGIFLSVPETGFTEVVCMPEEELEAALIDWYEEQPSGEAYGNLVLWKSDAGGTWTIVNYRSDGTACSLESGTKWNVSWSISERVENAKY